VSAATSPAATTREEKETVPAAVAIFETLPLQSRARSTRPTEPGTDQKLSTGTTGIG
jgi:hypothetical protein